MVKKLVNFFVKLHFEQNLKTKTNLHTIPLGQKKKLTIDSFYEVLNF